MRGVGVGFGVLAISILATGAALSAPTARAAPADNPPGCVLTLVGTKLVCLPTPTPPAALPLPTPTPKPAPAPTPSPCVLGLVGNCIVGGNAPPPVGSGPPPGGQGCTLNVLNAACVGKPGGPPVTLGPGGSGPGAPGGGAGQGSAGTCLPGNIACTCPAGASVGQACSTGPTSGGAVGTAGGLTAASGSGAPGLSIPSGPPLPGTSGSSFPAAAAATVSAAGNGGLSHPAVTATRDLGAFSGLDLSNLALWPIFLVLDALALAGLFLLLRRSWSTRPVN